MLFHETLVKEGASQERLVHLACGLRKVRLPNRREELTLVVVKGFGEEPLMILTNLPVRRSRKSVWHVVQSYITRWRIEDVICFVKQSYRLEDICMCPRSGGDFSTPTKGDYYTPANTLKRYLSGWTDFIRIFPPADGCQEIKAHGRTIQVHS